MKWLDRLLGVKPAAPRRNDGWANPYTGFGTARDRAMSTMFQIDALLTPTELDSLYYGSDIAAKIVDFRPNEMFRRGYEVRIDDTEDGEGQDSSIPDELMARARELGLDDKLLEAMKWSRLYGGALVILGLNDGNDASQPLNETTIRSLDYVHVIDKRYALALTYYSDPLAPRFGYPETYQIGDPLFGNWSIVHESRCLRFDGVKVDARRRRQNAGWGNSVLQRPYESIRDFSTAFQAVGFMVSDASQGVFKLHGLIDAIAANQEAAIQERMRIVDMSRGVARSVLLDAGNGEEFSKVPTSFAGVADVLDRYMLRLASASDMPVTILMGRSPAGMNATGESDFRAFYATVESDQQNMLQPTLQRAYTLLASSMGIRNIEGLDFYFCPLWSPTDKEQADLEYMVAQKDNLYMTAGVLHPSEVALSRYGGGQFSQSTEIDVDSRNKELERDIENTLNPPEPPSPTGNPNDPNAPSDPNTPPASPPNDGNQPQDSPPGGTKPADGT